MDSTQNTYKPVINPTIFNSKWFSVRKISTHNTFVNDKNVTNDVRVMPKWHFCCTPPKDAAPFRIITRCHNKHMFC